MSALFKPFKLGNLTLKHRIVMAPLTRYRADDNHVHTDTATKYYGQRASDGGLQFTEATFITEEAGGYTNVPGIWNDAQITAWKRITDAVHSKGGFIFLQLWALGRAAEPEVLKAEGHPFVSASALTFRKDGVKPVAMTKDDIARYTQDFAQAAKNSIQAGFDGVEIHGANGYLLDQFLQDVSNERTDEYGGSIENRARFPLEVTEAVTKAVGEERVGIRLSPYNTYQGMAMKDPVPQFSYIVEQLRDRFPKLAFIHFFATTGGTFLRADSVQWARDVWNAKGQRPILIAGGLTPEFAEEDQQKFGELSVFGRSFISNPDLPYRIKNKIPLTEPNPATFYVHGPQGTEGYIDYPFASGEEHPRL